MRRVIISTILAMGLLSPGTSLAESTSANQTWGGAWCGSDERLIESYVKSVWSPVGPLTCNGSYSSNPETGQISLSLEIDNGSLPSSPASAYGWGVLYRALPDPEGGPVTNRYEVTIQVQGAKNSSDSPPLSFAGASSGGSVALMGATRRGQHISFQVKPLPETPGTFTFEFDDGGEWRNPPPGEKRWIGIYIRADAYLSGHSVAEAKTPGVGIPVPLCLSRGWPACSGLFVPSVTVSSDVVAAEGKSSVDIGARLVDVVTTQSLTELTSPTQGGS